MHILQSIPHHRVVSGDVQTAEIFDLYQLGIFSLPPLTNQISNKPVNIELVELPAQTNYRPHCHKKSAAVICIISGCGTFRLGVNDIEYQPGKSIAIPAGVLHGFATQSQTLFLSLQSPPIINPENGQMDLHYENQ